MAEYTIDFESISIEASNSEEAFQKARQLISEGSIEIDQICENDR